MIPARMRTESADQVPATGRRGKRLGVVQEDGQRLPHRGARTSRWEPTWGSACNRAGPVACTGWIPPARSGRVPFGVVLLEIGRRRTNPPRCVASVGVPWSRALRQLGGRCGDPVLCVGDSHPGHRQLRLVRLQPGAVPRRTRGRADRATATTPSTIDDVEPMDPDGILISPGTGTPSDAGLSNTIIAQWGAKVPLLGVCLGLQCIGEVFGGGSCELPRSSTERPR